MFCACIGLLVGLLTDPGIVPDGEILYHVTGEVQPYIDTKTITEILYDVGFPQDVIPEALEVISCESGANLDISMYELVNGTMTGTFQIHPASWGLYCGVDQEDLLDPFVNASCALMIYQYDKERGNPDWFQWACKPS